MEFRLIQAFPEIWHQSVALLLYRVCFKAKYYMVSGSWLDFLLLCREVVEGQIQNKLLDCNMIMRAFRA